MTAEKRRDKSWLGELNLLERTCSLFCRGEKSSGGEERETLENLRTCQATVLCFRGWLGLNSFSLFPQASQVSRAVEVALWGMHLSGVYTEGAIKIRLLFEADKLSKQRGKYGVFFCSFPSIHFFHRLASKETERKKECDKSRFVNF